MNDHFSYKKLQLTEVKKDQSHPINKMWEPASRIKNPPAHKIPLKTQPESVKYKNSKHEEEKGTSKFLTWRINFTEERGPSHDIFTPNDLWATISRPPNPEPRKLDFCEGNESEWEQPSDEEEDEVEQKTWCWIKLFWIAGAVSSVAIFLELLRLSFFQFYCCGWWLF